MFVCFALKCERTSAFLIHLPTCDKKIVPICYKHVIATSSHKIWEKYPQLVFLEVCLKHLKVICWRGFCLKFTLIPIGWLLTKNLCDSRKILLLEKLILHSLLRDSCNIGFSCEISLVRQWILIQKKAKKMTDLNRNRKHQNVDNSKAFFFTNHTGSKNKIISRELCF